MVVGGGLGKDDGVDDRANYGRRRRESRLKWKTRAMRRLLPLARRGIDRESSLEEKKKMTIERKIDLVVRAISGTRSTILREPRAGEEAACVCADWC